MRTISVSVDGENYELALERCCDVPATYSLRLGERQIEVIVPVAYNRVEDIDWLIIDGRPVEISCEPHLFKNHADSRGEKIRVRDFDSSTVQPLSLDGGVKSPIPGLIVRVLAGVGQAVEIGQPLLILEAMKMHNEIRAPRSGVVEAVHVCAGQSVGQLERLVDID